MPRARVPGQAAERTPRELLVEQMKRATPAERRAFLKAHPRLADVIAEGLRRRRGRGFREG